MEGGKRDTLFSINETNSQYQLYSPTMIWSSLSLSLFIWYKRSPWFLLIQNKLYNNKYSLYL